MVGLRGTARCKGSQKSPALWPRDLPGRGKGSLGSGRHSCLYRGSGTTMASLTCSVGDEQGLLRCIRSSSLSCLMVDHVLLSKALILAKYLSCLGIW